METALLPKGKSFRFWDDSTKYSRVYATPSSSYRTRATASPMSSSRRYRLATGAAPPPAAP